MQRPLSEIAIGVAPPRVLVVGDLMLDSYVHGSVRRVSPESPVPIFQTTHQEDRLGGAGSVAAMLKALGACVDLGPDDVDPGAIARAAVTYLEGYLWDPPAAKDAFRKAMTAAHEAGRKVALSRWAPQGRLQ